MVGVRNDFDPFLGASNVLRPHSCHRARFDGTDRKVSHLRAFWKDDPRRFLHAHVGRHPKNATELVASS